MKANSFFNLVVLIAVVSSNILSFTSASASTDLSLETKAAAQADSTDQIIIKYKATSAAAAPNRSFQMQRLNAAAGVNVSYRRAMSGSAHVLSLPSRLPVSQVKLIAQKLMSLPEVQYAEPDQIAHPSFTPNDTRYSDQWDLFDTWGINTPAAWDITKGSNNVAIAVLDTGITNHVDLSGRTLPGYDFITDTNIANDGDGRDSDPTDPGDWCDSYGTFSDWHGTHVSGTIGAASNNSEGIAGINWVSKIVPVRVLGACGGYTSDITDGMRWAAGLSVAGVPDNPNPARVLNMSLEEFGPCSTTYQYAVNDLIAAGSVVVVAAGNDKNAAAGYQPASCSGVITVAATTIDGQKADYSNDGSSIEISAPGGGATDHKILSTMNTGTTVTVSDTYDYESGTSMSAPHVTGVVSLMLSVAPQLTPAEVLQILQSTAKPFPAGGTCTTANCGSGVVDAADAVQAAKNYIGVVRFVVPNGLSSGSCDAWANGCSLQYALSIVSAGEQVWVKAGTYIPDASNRNVSFNLKNNVAIYGGFAGTETLRSQRNPTTNVTILSGDLNGDDSGFTNNGENTYQVVAASNTNSSAVLDGFTISGGNAYNGAGIYIYNGTPTLTNLIIKNNYASNGGGGMMFESVANPTISNITFIGNFAGTAGGGGLLNWVVTNLAMNNVTFANNSTSSNNGGGGMISYSSSVTIKNATFSGNSATNSHGGGIASYGTTPILVNTIIANSIGGDCIGTLDASSKNNLIETAYAADPNNVTCELQNGIQGNIVGSDPALGALANNGGFTPTMALVTGSPAIDKGDSATCIDAASVNSLDQRGRARSQGGICDIGSYELIKGSVTFKSSGAQDGWILESSELSNKGGSINATAATINLGDDRTKKQYLGILSFNTSSIPDNAVITKITLKVKQQGIFGGVNPITMFGGFMVDIKNGFFGLAILQAADFQTAASKPIGPFKPVSVGGWYSIDLTPAKAYINKLVANSGMTQIRLRFKIDDNNNTIANYLSFYSGNAPAVSQPQLIIQFYVP